MPGLPIRWAQEHALASAQGGAALHPANYSKPAAAVTWLMLRKSHRPLYIDAPKNTCVLKQTRLGNVLLISLK